MNSPHPKTFAELYCEQHALLPADFERVIIERSLHPQARVLHRLLQLMPGDYFRADIEFVRNVGQLTRPDDFGWEVSDFHAHPANRQMLRRRLKLRLSISLLRRIVVATFKAAGAKIDSAHPLPINTADPFGSSAHPLPAVSQPPSSPPTPPPSSTPS